MNQQIRDYMASLGRKGGRATGARKRRSDAHYIELARKGVEARQKKRKKALENTGKPSPVET